MQQVIIKTVSTSAIADLLVDGAIEQQVDTGSSSVISLSHAILGPVTVMTNTMDEMGVVILTRQAAELFPD